MSLNDLLTVVNSDPKTTLNHINWLTDYKTYGENSYVFQNKDILHELYRDYKLTINDVCTISEVISYASEEGINLGSVFKNFVPFKNCKDQISGLTDPSGFFEPSTISVLDIISNSIFKSAFFDNDVIMQNLSNVETCKLIFANASIPTLSAIEASNHIKKYTDLNASITSITGNPAYGNSSLVVENAFITTIEVGVCRYNTYHIKPNASLTWMDDSNITVFKGYPSDPATGSGSKSVVDVYRFVKKLTIGTVNMSMYTLGEMSKINYIPLAN